MGGAAAAVARVGRRTAPLSGAWERVLVGMMSAMSDTPQARAHADERFRRWQHTRLHDPHIAVQNRLAEQMEADTSGGGLPVPASTPPVEAFTHELCCCCRTPVR